MQSANQWPVCPTLAKRLFQLYEECYRQNLLLQLTQRLQLIIRHPQAHQPQLLQSHQPQLLLQTWPLLQRLILLQILLSPNLTTQYQHWITLVSCALKIASHMTRRAASTRVFSPKDSHRNQSRPKRDVSPTGTGSRPTTSSSRSLTHPSSLQMRPASGTSLTNATRLVMSSTFMSPISNLRSTSWTLLFLPWAEPV